MKTNNLIVTALISAGLAFGVTASEGKRRRGNQQR
jgi:hypothetical protein